MRHGNEWMIQSTLDRERNDFKPGLLRSDGVLIAVHTQREGNDMKATIKGVYSVR